MNFNVEVYLKANNSVKDARKNIDEYIEFHGYALSYFYLSQILSS